MFLNFFKKLLDYTVFVTLFVLIVSCQPKEKVKRDIEQVTIAFEFESKYKAESLFDLIEIIPLPDEPLLGKVQKILFSKDRWYLLDQSAQNIKIYEKSGRYLSSFGTKGGGPGEYSYLSDISIKGDTIFLVDGQSFRYFFFSLAGQYLGERQQEYYTEELDFLGSKEVAYSPSNITLANTRSVHDDMTLVISSGDQVMSYFPYRDNHDDTSMAQLMSVYKDRLYFVQPIAHKIQMLDKGITHKESFFFDFGSYAWPISSGEIAEMPTEDAESIFNETNILSFLQYLGVSNNYFFLTALKTKARYIDEAGREDFWTIVANPATKKGLAINQITTSWVGEETPFPLNRNQIGDSLVSVVYQEDIISNRKDTLASTYLIVYKAKDDLDF
jgi:hypothetical protein